MAQDSSFTRPFKNELVRKLLHLPVFVFPVVALYSKEAVIILIAVLMAGYIGILILETKYERKVFILSPLINFCKRNIRYDLAPLYLALGMLIAVMISEPSHVFYAAYVVAICDSMAALVGIKYGQSKIFYLPKSYQGSAVFFVTSFLGCLYYLPPIHALVTAAVLTLAEMLSPRGWDNLLLPIFSMVMLRLYI